MESNFKPLVEGDSISMIERLREAVATALARPDYQEPTFKCHYCCDTQFLTRADSKGRVFGSPCECLLTARANKPKIEAVKFRGRGSDRPIVEDEGIPF